MLQKWLNKKGNKDLIVFFNGWGMDEKIVSHLDCSSFDVLMFYDYRNLEIEEFNFSEYDKKHLIAWSLGVFVCNYFYELFKNFNSFTAVNGTQKPIDDNFGIPEYAYNITIENFNDLTRSKFMNKINSNIDLKSFCTRTNDELKSELVFIKDLKINQFLSFNKVIISLKDRIIPSKNQMKFWADKNADIIELNLPHSIFDKYTSWAELL